MPAHAFMPDPDGDCAHCPLPAEHPSHTPAGIADTVPTTPSPGRRINALSKVEGMVLSASARASEEFRRTFFLTMAEIAVEHEYLTTNDAWDRLEAAGYQRSGTAQSVGTIGPSGCSIGLWERTEQTALNTSGNLHSNDTGVRVYRSLVVGKDFETEVAPAVRAKVEDLAAKALARDIVAGPATGAEQGPALGPLTRETRLVIPPGSSFEYAMVDASDPEEFERHQSRVLAAGGRIEARWVRVSPWEVVDG